ncbi:MAG: DotH/IcmK family type IV secretion protein [Legionellaceae bacterium]|nr:DotH/IcmK family type IV secretion protein [Legionellaceae bacterium]MBP9774544.1 DotH/IcmK family type IV secretion protein [Legionellaceae bacterium]
MKIAALWFAIVGLNVVITPAWAQDNGSTNQALDQLRMLQKKLAKDSPNMVQSSGPGPAVDMKSKPAGQLPNQQASQAQPSAPTPIPTVSPPPTSVITAEDEAESVDELAFRGVEAQLFPLNTDKIQSLKKKYEETEFAKAANPITPPKPTATSKFVNLSPGSTPPVIRLSQGFVSAIVFLDATGAPWPIAAFDLGDPSSFNIQWDKTGNNLMIQATKLYTYGNLAVRLTGLNTPVMITLIPGQKAVDYRVDLRVQGYGPNAKNMPTEEGLPPSASDVLLHVLDGVPPAGSTRLVVSGGDALAWLLDNKMYVRTSLTILSPGWLGSMTSADGTHAYEMPKSPVLLVSWHGRVMQLKIEGL